VISPAGQGTIAAYKIGGEQLFFPNALTQYVGRLLESLLRSLGQQLNRLLRNLAVLELAQRERVERLRMALLEGSAIPHLSRLPVHGITVLAGFEIPSKMMLRFTPAVFGCAFKPVICKLNVQGLQIGKSVVLPNVPLRFKISLFRKLFVARQPLGASLQIQWHTFPVLIPERRREACHWVTVHGALLHQSQCQHKLAVIVGVHGCKESRGTNHQSLRRSPASPHPSHHFVA
jgi:hypothetical protein